MLRAISVSIYRRGAQRLQWLVICDFEVAAIRVTKHHQSPHVPTAGGLHPPHHNYGGNTTSQEPLSVLQLLPHSSTLKAMSVLIN